MGSVSTQTISLLGYDITWLPPVASTLVALAAFIAAWVAYRNISRQLAEQARQNDVRPQPALRDVNDLD